MADKFEDYVLAEERKVIGQRRKRLNRETEAPDDVGQEKTFAGGETRGCRDPADANDLFGICLSKRYI